MTRGVKIRIAAFLVLSAVGIVYVTASYLGFVDKVLGRGLVVEAQLPASGGLFEGSEVTYRGVKVGKVASMRSTGSAVLLRLALEEGTELPLDSLIRVHNLSAVGEQYLDFEPPDDRGPYATEGVLMVGDDDSLPVDEGELLVDLDEFVTSVDQRDLQVVVRELGTLFAGTGQPLQTLIDSGNQFVDEASAHTDDTTRLLDTLLPVLRTQSEEGDAIVGFSDDLDEITTSLAASDDDLRTVLTDTPGTAAQVDQLLTGLEPTIPVLLGNAVGLGQVVVAHLAGIEQLLVTYPRVISAGFTGTPADGYGHVDLQLNYDVPPCTQGYLPSTQWRPASDLTDAPVFPATCTQGGATEARGTPNVPDRRALGDAESSPRIYRSSYDPTTGVLGGAVDAAGNPVRVQDPGDLSVLGDDSWKWLLVGAVAAP